MSLNQLKGEVPEALRSMHASTFSGNILCGSSLKSWSGGSDTIVHKNEKKHKLSGGALARIVIRSVVGFVLILIVFFSFVLKEERKEDERC